MKTFVALITYIALLVGVVGARLLGQKEKKEKLEEPACIGADRIECHDKNEKKLFICHKGKTLCIAEEGVRGHLKKYHEDYCGECKPDIGEECGGLNATLCDDSNLCTTDQPVCVNDTWACLYTDSVICKEGESCDPKDGQCKPDDQVIPCVAVIDEDSSFTSTSPDGKDQNALWADFRTEYPYRPFCLLVPYNSYYSTFVVPPALLNDTNARAVIDINKDNGDTSLAEDWASLCGLNSYTSSNVGFVGLFVDVSGSMVLSHVQASYDLFNTNMNASGIEVREVYNGNENWILPFMTTLAPTTTTTTTSAPIATAP